MMSAMEIAEFIAARLANEERDARAATAQHSTGGWSISGLEVWDNSAAVRIADTGAWLPPAEHIVRQDPAATLARVEALRALVGLHAPVDATWVTLDAGSDPFLCPVANIDTEWPHRFLDQPAGPMCLTCDGGTPPCVTLRHVAAIWRDHEDYDERWKP